MCFAQEDDQMGVGHVAKNNKVLSGF